MKRILALCWLLPLVAGNSYATDWDVYKKDTWYHAGTYVNFGSYGTHISRYGNSYLHVVDINVRSPINDNDGNFPVYAPENGSIKPVTKNDGTDGGYGNSLEWTNTAGTETLFLAHLKDPATARTVSAGDPIGIVSGTGNGNANQWDKHLHIERKGGPLFLSGKEIKPGVNSDPDTKYLSKGWDTTGIGSTNPSPDNNSPNDTSENTQSNNPVIIYGPEEPNIVFEYSQYKIKNSLGSTTDTIYVDEPFLEYRLNVDNKGDRNFSGSAYVCGWLSKGGNRDDFDELTLVDCDKIDGEDLAPEEDKSIKIKFRVPDVVDDYEILACVHESKPSGGDNAKDAINCDDKYVDFEVKERPLEEEETNQVVFEYKPIANSLLWKIATE